MSTPPTRIAPQRAVPRGTPSTTPTPRAKAAAIEAPPVQRMSTSCGIHDDADVPPLRR